ncbi:MAG: hypothetical protein IPM37_07440 [Hahellaceae bacterium]|nr:hypothetical protein [Hahellaceae bacterium]
MKVTYRICALALISLSCLTVPSYAVDALDESGLDELHLEGLDAPAAGPSRTAVSGSVMKRSIKDIKDREQRGQEFDSPSLRVNPTPAPSLPETPPATPGMRAFFKLRTVFRMLR